MTEKMESAGVDLGSVSGGTCDDLRSFQDISIEYPQYVPTKTPKDRINLYIQGGNS